MELEDRWQSSICEWACSEQGEKCLDLEGVSYENIKKTMVLRLMAAYEAGYQQGVAEAQKQETDE